jgi:aminopeptidase
VSAAGVAGGVELSPPPRYLEALAELAVGVGANVQPGQVVGLNLTSGQEAIGRAVAEAAYARGARYVDLWVFDPFLKHSRLKHAPLETLSYVAPWIGQRVLELGEMNAARIAFQGPTEPALMDDIEPDRLGLDMMPRLRESMTVVAKQLTNWSMLPFPNPQWATLVYPELAEAAAFERLWEQIAHICRLNEPDPTAAWVARMEALEAQAAKLDELTLDAVRFVGPGTNLTVGLLPSSRWISGRMKTVTGIVHAANIPTEEVFTAPDPLRVEGHVRATKPLFIPGSATIEGLTVRFEGGRAVEVDADKGGGILRTMTQKDEGACRLGELALVDRESRIGQSGTVFYDILLDENAASHIAVGNAYPFSVSSEEDRARVNTSAIHIDFMIGSDEMAVDGVLRDGTVVPLLREGVWQV